MAKSRYTGKSPKKFKAMRTIGALKKAISDIPDSIPLEGHFFNTATLEWFNAGQDDEVIAFSEKD